MAYLSADDLAAFAEIDPVKAEEMVHDATALAVLAAPCLEDEESLTENQVTAVKAILRRVVLRWNDGAAGAIQSESIGSFQQVFDTTQSRRGLFTPAEISQLQGICAGEGDGGAFSIDTYPFSSVVHADICSVNFGANYCSCGAWLTGSYPLYET
jgi:hypothetical protein